FEGASPDGEVIFAEKSRPAQVFVDGVKFDIERKKSKGNPDAKVDPRGSWSVVLTVGGRTLNRTWTIKGTPGNYAGTAETQAGLVSFVSVKLAGDEMTVVLPGQGGRPSQEIVVIIKADVFEGSGDTPGGGSLAVKGSRVSGPEGGAL
ncbi:MAG TPA: hypothetical protein VFE84_13420, partial [Patescibacteria group bacterium]|nr:hypothetical protein [Patescibacteria group bacterium]